MRKTLITVNSFFAGAKQMRAHFDERFADPRSTRTDRFIWDYWHVPGQYTALRTPAYHFFPKKIYDVFHNHLVWWGRRNLGCHDISPPWMSCYVDGCRQELHGDLPHGPWAFVFSLTPWKQRRFTGGETLILREEILEYWHGFQSTRSLEEKDILIEVPSLFNRLTVFDPRIPHGVREVEGSHDIRDGRLVIHGWFVQPRPFIEGPLPTRELQAVIDDLSGSLNDLFMRGLEIHGTLSLNFSVTAQGKMGQVKVLSNALRHPSGDRRVEAALLRHISIFLRRASFRKQRGPSQITLPLIFEAR